MLNYEIRKRIEGTEGLDTARKANVVRMANRIDNYIIKNNIQVKDIEVTDVENIIRGIGSVSMSSIYQYIQHTRDYFSIMGIKKTIDTDAINPKTIISDTKDRYFTKQEIQDICDLLLNPQDRFIIYGLFLGIHGKANEDLLNVKIKDLDMKKRIINVKGRKVEMDDYMYQVCKDTIDPEFGLTYYRYIEEGNRCLLRDSYELNPDSEYVIKPMPYKRNNYGVEAMKASGIRRRLDMLNKFMGRNLASIDLVRSGFIYKMSKIQKIWTVSDIADLLKKNNLNMKAHEIQRIYELKYK